LEIAFDTKDLRTLIETDRALQSKFGPLYIQVKSKISDLIAIEKVNELLPETFTVVSFKSIECIRVTNLNGDFEIIFCSNHIKVPAKTNGDTDWSKVKRIKILEIVQINA